ncbi:pyrimidine reductase family protein [Saccharomonospora sp. NPDC046836]|uniref:pyrimidine reductase family protein n=1 Tax=Saccharomonospora sp. NPDC046836 TaxID=3156921 RepID=UPI0033CEB915
MNTVHCLWPLPPDTASRDPLTDADLERIYAYPDDLERPWVQVNFVCSADGAVSVDGRSEGLSHPADKRIFALGRDLADVVLVGATTVRTEKYRGVKRHELRVERRRRLGLSDVPPIAVVSGRCTITPDDLIVTDTAVPPIVLTTEDAPATRRDALTAAGADVIVVGERSVDLPAALGVLHTRGLRRINCEGGPHLFGTLIAEDLVDQLCLTVAPLLAGAGADRIATGPTNMVPQRMRLASMLHEDGFLMMRYRREAG